MFTMTGAIIASASGTNRFGQQQHTDEHLRPLDQRNM